MRQQVLRNDERSRYELLIDDELVGVADFVVNGSTVILPHTEISSAMRGRGLGAILVQGVLDDVRRRGEVVVPSCWYVREYVEHHPAEADLLAT